MRISRHVGRFGALFSFQNWVFIRMAAVSWSGTLTVYQDSRNIGG